MDTRYRIENEAGRVWDSTNRQWVRASSGDYNTYKSAAAAVAAGRRTKNQAFRNESPQVVEDKETP